MIVRIGQLHWRAKLTDHEVELVRLLLAERRTLIAVRRGRGESQGNIDQALRDTGLSFAGIAAKFEVSKSLVRAIDTWRVRAMAAPSRW